MHILLVSSAIENLPGTNQFKRLKEIKLRAADRLESQLNTNLTLDLVFFDAALGSENISQQIQLYQQKNQPIKWLVINTTDIQQSLLYL